MESIESKSTLAVAALWREPSAGATLSLPAPRFVEEAAAAGEIARIEIVDNQRAVLERKSAVISAERELQNAVFELSLFYRSASGEPQIVSRERPE